MQAVQPVKPGFVSSSPVGDPIVKIDTLFKEFLDIKDTNEPVANQAARQARFDKLSEAYATALSQLPSRNPVIMARMAMILGEFGAMLYGKEPKYPGKTFPEEAEFTLSRQIHLGALQAFLVRIGADQVSCDFGAKEIADLQKMPPVILDLMPFASVEEGFITADKQQLIQLATDAKFSDLEAVHFSRMLRYLNGASRYLRSEYKIHAMNQREKPGEEKEGEMTPEDIKLTVNCLYLARHFARCDDKEFWELMYNDWADAMKALGHWNEETKLEHISWLQKNAKSDSEVARVCNKFLPDVAGTRQSLNKCLEIIKRKMNPADYALLTDVIQGRMLDKTKIQLLVKTLCSLDFTENDHLTISWFAIIPSNLACRLMKEKSNDLNEIEGLLLLAGTIVEEERAAGNHHVNFKAIEENSARFLLSKNHPMRIAMAQATEAGAFFRNAAGNLRRPPQETLDMLRKAQETALLAKAAFGVFLTREGPRTPEMLAADRVVQESQTLTETILSKIEQITKMLQQPSQK